MKILQVITSLYVGGAEKLIVDMVPLYLEQGYQVDVLLFDGTDTPFKKQLQARGVKVYHLRIGGSVYNPLFIFKLIPFLKRYDIVHTHNTACQYFAVLAKYFSFNRVKLVTTEHNTTNRRRSIGCFRPIDKFIYNQYDTVISISDATTDLLTQYLGLNYPVQTIFNGINLSVFQYTEPLDRTQFALPPVLCLITMVAGFREQKDQDTLIRSFSYLPSEYKLCLVGDGIRRPVCEALTKDLGLEDRVVFTGIRNDIPQIMKMSDVIVVSSHWEGFGLVAVEGMAAGKPVVASDVLGLAEVVNGAGILFSHGDEKALAVILQKLMNDKSYYQQIVGQCQQRASEYDIRKTVDAYVDIYKQLCYV